MATTITSGKLTIVNPTNRAWTDGRWLVTLGAYGETRLVIWANGADSALDEAIDWAAEHAPGYLADDEAAEAYREAIAEGLSEDKATDEASTDLTCGGNAGHYIRAWEWTINEASREMLLAMRD